MSIRSMHDTIPCVLFAYNRPDKFAQIVSAVKTQNVDHIIVFIDGPKNNAAVKLVEECKKIARGIDWIDVDYFFKEKNEGLAGILNNIGAVFQSYKSAVFVEDDCLPMPAFYPVMKRALSHYKDDERVFSIGGYQHIPYSFFKSYPYTFVSSARFTCWGWASWRDRWDVVAPYFPKNRAKLEDYKNIPDIVGDDLISFARSVSAGGKRLWETSSWDIKVAILALYFGKVHLLPTRGLIKNIGFDTGIHFAADPLNSVIYNRNVYDRMITSITWLEDTKTYDEYNKRSKTIDNSVYNYFIEKAASNAIRTDHRTLAEIIVKAPRIITYLIKDPVRTIKRIALIVAQRLTKTRMSITRKRKIANYDEYLICKRDARNKRALLSYLVEPLRVSQDKGNRTISGNRAIAHYIPRALNELGYSVDIVNCDNEQFKLKRKYDLFIGHAAINYESIHSQLPSDATSIYFSTGAYRKSSTEQRRKRFEALYERRGIILPQDTFLDNNEESANVSTDGVICLGNDYVREAYRQYPLVVSLNNAAFQDNNYNYTNKDFREGINNFLFYSGPGNVHTGLDLLLDVFLHTKNHLYICTVIEPLFEKAFFEELHGLSNIHLLETAHALDQTIYPTLNRCNFLIYPSCSEGQPSPVIECMHKGLIPILSRESNIDTGEFGITLDTCSVEEILRVVQHVSRMSPEWCRERSLRTRGAATKHYTAEKFLENMKNAIRYIRDHRQNPNEKTALVS
jgi:hypothetical protein